MTDPEVIMNALRKEFDWDDDDLFYPDINHVADVVGGVTIERDALAAVYRDLTKEDERVTQLRHSAHEANDWQLFNERTAYGHGLHYARTRIAQLLGYDQ